MEDGMENESYLLGRSDIGVLLAGSSGIGRCGGWSMLSKDNNAAQARHLRHVSQIKPAAIDVSYRISVSIPVSFTGLNGTICRVAARSLQGSIGVAGSVITVGSDVEFSLVKAFNHDTLLVPEMKSIGDCARPGDRAGDRVILAAASTSQSVRCSVAGLRLPDWEESF